MAEQLEHCPLSSVAHSSKITVERRTMSSHLYETKIKELHDALRTVTNERDDLKNIVTTTAKENEELRTRAQTAEKELEHVKKALRLLATRCVTSLYNPPIYSSCAHQSLMVGHGL